ncbi:MAG: DUF512 domain-containing protein [Lachnospiraceae bacterium]|nr:DUF512 domain-containing protein [Lachnospiraceae bacterium]
MKNHEHRIVDVLPDGPCGNTGIQAGDYLLAVNGRTIIDILDYHFEELGEELTLTIRHEDGTVEDYEIEKDEDEEIGLVYAESLMDDYRSCRNRCIFCFIDQMPPGMRETLYFKDDDTRLSFLQGNYVTMTNVSEEEIERICYYKLSPINVSVHTTNPELRRRMLCNRFAGEILTKLDRLKEAGITMNGQVVLVKGVNDGAELERTIHDLTAYLPNMQSLSIVPVGLTKFRDKLPKLEPFEKEDAKEVLGLIRKWQGICREYFGTNFVYASDEWYLVAGEDLPGEEDYEGYPQIENGVGMIRSLVTEVHEVVDQAAGDDRKRTLTIATGKLAAPTIRELCGYVATKFPNISVNVVAIRNDFFGERITVSGLLTGTDIIAQLKDVPLGDRLILPQNLLRSGEDVLLDDMTVGDIEKALGINIRISKATGRDFLDSLTE